MHEQHFKKVMIPISQVAKNSPLEPNKQRFLKIHFLMCFFRVPVVPAVESSQVSEVSTVNLLISKFTSHIIELRRRKRDQNLNPQNICFRQ